MMKYSTLFSLCALLGLVGGGTGTLSLTYNGLCLARLTPLWDGGEGSLFVSLPTPIKPKNGHCLFLFYNELLLAHISLLKMYLQSF